MRISPKPFFQNPFEAPSEQFQTPAKTNEPLGYLATTRLWGMLPNRVRDWIRPNVRFADTRLGQKFVRTHCIDPNIDINADEWVIIMVLDSPREESGRLYVMINPSDNYISQQTPSLCAFAKISEKQLTSRYFVEIG